MSLGPRFDTRPAGGPSGRAPLFGRVFTIAFTHKGVRRSFRLGSGPATIGSAPTCDIQIRGAGVAPVHCRIERTSDGGRFLFAAGNEHPLSVNGVPIEFRRLDGGETIVIGAIKLVVQSRLGHVSGDGAVRSEIGFESDFGSQLRRSLRRWHWMALSGLAHLLVVLFVSWLLEEKQIAAGAAGFIQQSIADWSDQPFSMVEPGGPEGEIEFDEPATSVFETPEPTPVEEPMAGKDNILKDPDAFGPYGQGGEGLDRAGSATIGKTLGGGGDGVLSLGGGTGWDEHIGRLRSTGLDVAILFDSTGSMVNLIKEVKGTISEMAKVLDRIVPDLRIALITYKGDEHASSYVVAGTPLVADIFELMNFIECVEISGGSTEGYAALHKALTQAVNNLAWRKSTRKAIVIIGDAPPFPDTHAASLQRIRAFDGSVSAIYKDSDQTPGNLEPVTVNTFRKFAMAGRGEFIRYDVSGDVVRHIAAAILGTEWDQQIRAVFASRESGRWQNVLERRVASRDVDWFMGQFVQERTRPEAVDALIRIGGREVAARMWKIIKDGVDAPWLLQRCLYVLNKTSHVHIDYLSSSRTRLAPRQLKYIEGVLSDAYGKEFEAEAKR